jgi:hypothetical protein
MKRLISLALFVWCAAMLHADDRPKIDALLNREILIQDGWAGQSVTLKKDSAGYFVIRTYFGSGLPVVGTVRYKVKVLSPYQVRFSEIEDGTGIGQGGEKQEEFVLSIAGESDFELFLNGLRVAAEIPKTTRQ